jgi:hypothetical protein
MPLEERAEVVTGNGVSSIRGGENEWKANEENNEKRKILLTAIILL